MKTILTIVCMMAALCSVGATQKSSAKKTSFSESELRTLATVAPDVKNGGQLYSVAMATTNAERKQEYLKAAAACLIACGKNDVYKKHVKGKLQGTVEFEDGLKDECKQCAGAGTKARRCSECSGRGQCSRCKGSGQTTHVGFDRSNTVKACSKCNGDRRCSKCGGEGSKKEKCLSCAGTGKSFSEAIATRVFHESCNAIADNMMLAHESKNDATPKNETNGKSLSEKSKATGPVNANAEGKEGGSVRTDNILSRLEDLKQRRYSLRDVVSVGKAMLSTRKIPSEAISRTTPFHCRGSNNELELREVVRATVKSAQTLLSDIDANKVEVSKGEFNPADYIEFWHKDTTKICKQRLFDEIWEKALYSPHLQHDANNNPLSKALFSKIPDNMVFVVNDVSLVELNRGGRVYCVKLTPLVFGEKNRMLGMVGNGRECQTKRYIELAEKAGFLARGTRGTVKLLVPTSPGNESVEEWKKGDTVISKGWINAWTITNAVRTYDGGRKEEIREIEMSVNVFRAFRDWEEMNHHVSL